jgi:hypothetical protein
MRPITLHWTWELEDDFAGVARLAGLVASRAARWETLASADAAPPHEERR